MQTRKAEAVAVMRLTQEEAKRTPNISPLSIKPQMRRAAIQLIRSTQNSQLLPPDRNVLQHIVLTLLGFPSSEDVCFLFLLNYFLKYRKNKINLIRMRKDVANEDHSVLYIGEINAASAHLITEYFKEEKAPSPTDEPRATQTLNQFLLANKNGIIIDPWLNCCGNSEKELSGLLEWGGSQPISHIIKFHHYDIQYADVIRSTATIYLEAIKSSGILTIAKPNALTKNNPVNQAEEKSSTTSTQNGHKKINEEAFTTSYNKAIGLFKKTKKDEIDLPEKNKKYEEAKTEFTDLLKILQKANLYAYTNLKTAGMLLHWLGCCHYEMYQSSIAAYYFEKAAAIYRYTSHDELNELLQTYRNSIKETNNKYKSYYTSYYDEGRKMYEEKKDHWEMAYFKLAYALPYLPHELDRIACTLMLEVCAEKLGLPTQKKGLPPVTIQNQSSTPTQEITPSNEAKMPLPEVEPACVEIKAEPEKEEKNNLADQLKQNDALIKKLQQELQTKKEARKKKREKHTHKVVTLQKQNNSIAADIQRNEDRAKEFEEKISTLNTHTDSVTSELQEAKKQLATITKKEEDEIAELQALQEQLDKTRRDIEGITEKNLSQAAEISRLESENAILETPEQNSDQQVSSARQSLNTRIKSLHQEREDKNASLIEITHVKDNLSKTLSSLRQKQLAKKAEKEKAKAQAENEWQERVNQYNSPEAEQEQDVRNKARQLIEAEFKNKRIDLATLPTYMVDKSDGLHVMLFPTRITGASAFAYDQRFLTQRFFKPRSSIDSDKKAETQHNYTDPNTGKVIPRDKLSIRADKDFEDSIDEFLIDHTDKSREEWMEQARVELEKEKAPFSFYSHGPDKSKAPSFS